MDEPRPAPRIRTTKPSALGGLFSIPFVVAGAYVLVTGIRAGQVVPIIFGVVFTTFSGSILWRGLNPKPPVLAAEHAAATRATLAKLAGSTAGAGYRSPALAPASAASLYEAVLPLAPLPTVQRRPGSDLAVELLPPKQEGVMFRIGFSIVWNAIVLPMFGGALWYGIRGNRSALLAAAFISIFVLAGSLVWFPLVTRALANRKLPRVEVDAEPAFLGDVVQVRVVHPRGCKLTTLDVSLVCREIVTFSEGTTTRTEEFEQARIPVLAEFAVSTDVEPAHRGQVTIPGDASHSFESEHNKLEWSLHVRADVPSWPDYAEHFTLRALPRPSK